MSVFCSASYFFFVLSREVLTFPSAASGRQHSRRNGRVRWISTNGKLRNLPMHRLDDARD